MSVKVDVLTREFPPFVYGGAGVHVEELSKVLRKILSKCEVTIRCFDGPRVPELGGTYAVGTALAGGKIGTKDDPWVFGYDVPRQFQHANPALATFSIDLQVANDCIGADIVHSHTWYANLAGFLASKLYDIPHVITAHSLEPLRPWKAEQLGGGYALSSWAEKLAYENAAGIIAVSAGMKKDILRCYPEVDPAKIFIVRNGIDLDSFKFTDKTTDVLERYDISTTAPTAIFVGRITRQKGLPYLLRAVEKLPSEIQVVLCAGAPDTKGLADEVQKLVQKLQKRRGNVISISEMLPKHELVAVLNTSDVFLCPSIYEPLGIVNLEAMVLKLPVVATATGGIPEVVQDGVTGKLVEIEQLDDGTGTPLKPAKFVQDLADAICWMFEDLERAKKLGEEGYKRAKEHFSWKTIGERTVKIYKELIKNYEKRKK
ncbi:MAG: glycogen synthase [Candidatus Ancillula trichonymphae]|jgi:starch synthase|nr:glycogen synthase [Candidatus Ancillula trichonymphae]